jgi:hypothetical protein
MDARTDYSVLISLASREEAEVAASALRAQGVDAFLGNSHHATAMPLAVQAMGGMQIMVPSAQLAEAKALLQARLKDWAQDDEDDEAPPKRRDRWKAWILLGLMFGPIVVMLVQGLGHRVLLGMQRVFGW